MLSSDYFVGFRIRPKLKDLASFLKDRAYFPDSDQQRGFTGEGDDGRVDLFYSPRVPAAVEDGVPDWRRARGARHQSIVAKLDITASDDASDRARRLAFEIATRYKAIVYDPDLDEYWQGKNLVNLI